MSNDYPFQNWNDYYEALRVTLDKQFFGDSYPAYYQAYQECNEIDIIIIRSLLEQGLDVQEGYNGFIEAILGGYRYSCEMKYTFPKVLNMFISRGAVPNIDILFTKNFTEEYVFIQGRSIHVSFEDEVGNYSSRGCLIDAFAEIYPTLDVSKYGDWQSMEETYWDDIPIKAKYDWNENQRLMALKSCSEYLKVFSVM